MTTDPTVAQDVGRLEGKVTLLLENMRQLQTALTEARQIIGHIDAKVSQFDAVKNDVVSLKADLASLQDEVEALQLWRNRLLGAGAVAGAVAGAGFDKVWKLLAGG